jgi:hypothetical protein
MAKSGLIIDVLAGSPEKAAEGEDVESIEDEAEAAPEAPSAAREDPETLINDIQAQLSRLRTMFSELQ